MRTTSWLASARNFIGDGSAPRSRRNEGMMLTSTDYALLEALDDLGGFPTRRVLEHVHHFTYGNNNRQRSAILRSRLMRLKEHGLVRFLDDKKPICWVRTKAGTDALADRAAAERAF